MGQSLRSLWKRRARNIERLELNKRGARGGREWWKYAFQLQRMFVGGVRDWPWKRKRP